MKAAWFALVLLLCAALTACAQVNAVNAVQGLPSGAAEKQPSVATEEKDVTALVENFGKKLQMVSLLAPEQSVRESMREHYADFVSPSLLETWQNDPLHAPGRTVSSPWPDRIDVLSVEKTADGAYRVKGEIIEITSAEQAGGGFAAKRPATFEVRKIGGRWLIDAAELGDYENIREEQGDDEDGKADAVVYENAEYGFRFHLPAGWKGYTIVQDRWEGLSLEEQDNGKVVASGPILSIRHPQWTAEQPRQDIPIMVLTIDQWNSLQREKFHIGAAPIGPRELGRNSRYVFALPARYNFAFPTGYEEVEDILNNNPLQPTEGNLRANP